MSNDFWEEAVMSGRCFRCGESVYFVGKENSLSSFRGFGGERYDFFLNGKAFYTTNLWYKGKCPEEYKRRFPLAERTKNAEKTWDEVFG